MSTSELAVKQFKSDSAANPFSPAHKGRLLLIEDEVDIAKPLAFRLRQMGFGVETAGDGLKGLTLALESRPDLIILDLTLPSLSGEEICKRVKEHDEEAIAKIPIIMLTAKTSEVDRIIGKVIGASSYLTKPFEISTLVQEIKRYLL